VIRNNRKRLKGHSVTIPALLNVETLADLIRQGERLKLIDVRSPAEFESVHIEGSYNLPLDLLPEHREELRDLLRSPTILICQSGNRARQAEQLLQASSLSNLHILDGGIAQWTSAGKAVVRGPQRWSMERQVRGLAGSIVLASVIASLFWKPFLILAAFIGAGLSYSALSNTCGMAAILSKLPYNKGASCDIRQVVARLGANE
jgi:rhodanese-related sulfurtransferase